MNSDEPTSSEKKAVKRTVLVVDDSPANIDVLRDILQPQYLILAALNGQEALEIAANHASPDIILQNIVLPGMEGYEVCRLLKLNPLTAEIPLIFIAANIETGNEEKGLALGAVDYISQPFSPAVVRARVHAHIVSHQMQMNLESLVEERTAEILQSCTLLRNSTGLLKALHEANPDLQFVLDKDHVITAYHAGSEGELYAPPTNCIGKKMHHVMPDKVGLQFQQAIDSATAASNLLVTIEYVLLIAGKERSCEARIVALEDNRLVITVRDISKQKQAIIERERVRAELRQAKKMAAVGAMAGGIAHDFNNIISITTGYVDMVIDKLHAGIGVQDGKRDGSTISTEIDESIKQQKGIIRKLEQVQIASQRAAQLVDKILVFSRRGKS